MSAQDKDAPELFTRYGERSPFAEAYRGLRISLFHGNGGSLR